MMNGREGGDLLQLVQLWRLRQTGGVVTARRGAGEVGLVGAGVGLGTAAGLRASL